jgi:hypothetical protein
MPRTIWQKQVAAILGRFSFGLAASALIAVFQFLGNARVPNHALKQLIAAIPFLALAGVLGETGTKSTEPVGRFFGIVTALAFAIGLILTLLGFENIFAGFDGTFGETFFWAVLFCLCTGWVCFKAIKRTNRKRRERAQEIEES